MNLKTKILAEHSKKNCDEIVAWIGKNKERFDNLLDLFFSDEYVVVQRCSWPLAYAATANPQLLEGHHHTLFENLSRADIHEAVKRNTLKLFETVPVPEDLEGRLMDLCFRYISGNQEKAAPKASCLTILQNLGKKYPEILPELKTVVEDRWPHETASFKARARNIISKKR